MFRGINSINVDTKGRIAIPVRYRKPLTDKAERQLVLTIDTEQITTGQEDCARATRGPMSETAEEGDGTDQRCLLTKMRTTTRDRQIFPGTTVPGFPVKPIDTTLSRAQFT